MLATIWVVSALCAVAFSAPTYSVSAAERPVEMKVLSEYFQLLGDKVQEGRKMAQAPVCNPSKAVMPVQSPTALPPVSSGLVLKHVAIGRGTQNYTCGTNATAAPAAIGAKATLYNATCVASTYPDLLAILPSVALQFNLTDPNQSSLAPSNLAISGHHFFTNTTTPAFDLDTSTGDLGFASCSKNNTVNAPAGSIVGQDNEGFGAVPWLKLLTHDGTTGNIQEIYRINTAGGSPPATCEGMPSTFEVQYAAEYWFWEAPS